MRSLKRVTLHSIIVSGLITLSMAAMTLGARPAEAAPFAYVANINSNNVSVIATASNTVVATIPTDAAGGCACNGAWGVAITPDGKFAYVTDVSDANGEATVSMIATTSNTVVATIPLGADAHDVAITERKFSLRDEIPRPTKSR